MYRVYCDRCGCLLHGDLAPWDKNERPQVRAAVAEKAVDLCPPCAAVVYASMTVFVASLGGYRNPADDEH